MYQKMTIVGNLGRDPEMRFTPSGQAVTNMNVATNNQYTNNSGEKVKETTWFRISVWGKQAESCNQYLQKGSTVLVEGRMTADKATGGPSVYESKGEWKASFEITAQTVRFLSSKSDATQEESVIQGQEHLRQTAILPPDEGLPF